MILANATTETVNVQVQNNNGVTNFDGDILAGKQHILTLSPNFTYSVTGNSGGSPAKATNVSADATVTFSIEAGQLTITIS